MLLGEKVILFIKNNDNFSQIRGKELSFNNGISLIATFSPSFY